MILCISDLHGTNGFKQWVFGHYHQDRSLDLRTRVIYNDIVELR